MKLDKETVIKHRFWFLLGTVVPLLIIMLCVLKFGVAGTVEERKKEYDSALTSVKGISNPKNAAFIQPVKEKEETLSKKKGKVWEEAWNGQGSFITWPQEMQRELGNNYFGQFISEVDRRRYARLYGDGGYVAKLERDFTELVHPVEFSGGFNRIIRTVPKWDENVPPLLEEVYLAQEDISVQRELLNIVRATLDSLKKFTLVEQPKGEKKPDLPSGVIAQYVFRNPNWEMTLSLALNEKKQLIVSGAQSFIKNINPSKRTMALDNAQFQVMQGQQIGAVSFRIPAEYVLWNQPVPLRNDISIDKFNKNSPIEVEQVFDWHTSPIKRVDALVMGYQSHRTANYALKMRKIDDTLQIAAGPTTSSGVGGFGGSGKFGGSVSPMPGGAGGAPVGSTLPGTAPADAAAAKPQDLTPNKLSRYRYLDVRDQVRWMPIGIVLVIDQSAMQDVLSAIANSRLRIQTTQVSWSHVSGIRSEKGDSRGETAGPAVSGPRPGGGDERNAGPASKFPGRPGTGSGFSSLLGGNVESRRIVSNQDDPNLVELSVYGIASLYERYPPRTATAAAPTTPTSPTDASKSPGK